MKYFSVTIFNKGMGDHIMALPYFNIISKYSTFINEKSLILVKSKVEKELLNLFHFNNLEISIIGDNPKITGVGKYIFLIIKILSIIKFILFIRTKKLIYLGQNESNIIKILYPFYKKTYVIGCSNNNANFVKHHIEPDNAENPKYHLSEFYKKFIPKECQLWAENNNIYGKPDLKTSILKNKLNIKKEPIVIFAPGSGELEKHKRWPHYHYVKLAKLILSEINVKILILGAKYEEYLINSIINEINHNKIIKAINPTIQETLSIFNDAIILITGDSGSAHLSNITNTTTIALWGPTNKNKTGPISKDLTYIDLNLDCAPCYHKSRVGCGDNQCMQKILPEHVLTIFLKKIPQNLFLKKNN